MSALRKAGIAAGLILAAVPLEPLFGLDPARALTQYVHERWGTERGLPQTTVRAVLQTRDGYLWIGTEEGLSRFDGVRFTTFNRRTVRAFRSNHVLSLLEDQEGTLWIGTHGGGLTRHRDGKFTTFTTSEGLPSNFVYSLHEDQSKTLWVGTRAGVCQFKAGRLIPFRPSGLVRGTIWSIRQDRSGVMWIGSDLHGLSRIDHGVLKTFDSKTGLPYDAISSILQLRDGRLIFGTNGAGLFEWREGRFVPFLLTGSLPSASIATLFEDSARILWIGTKSGLARARNGHLTTDAPGELGQSSIHTIVEDREGSLWIGGSADGLHRLRDGKVLTITRAEGLPSDEVRTIAHDQRGNTWIGTRAGVTRWSAQGMRTFTSGDGLPDESVRSLFPASDGVMWIGTDLGGVAQIAGDRMRSTVMDGDIPDNTVRAFAQQGESIWVGTNGGPLTMFTDGSPRHRIGPEAGRRIFARAMVADPRGFLWVATDGNGLLQFVDGKLRKTYTERDGLSSPSLRSLHLDAQGVLWIGTAGGGLNRLENGRIDSFTTEDGLFDDLVLQILEDEQGRLWMSSNNGISAVAKSSLDAHAPGKPLRIESLALDDRDGMKDRNCVGGSQPAGAKSSDGRLWFPTRGGVVIVDPKQLRRNDVVPPVFIETITAEGNPVAGGSAFEIPEGTKNLEIAYTALSFVVPERVRFKYKLEGHDETWIDAGTRRTAYYSGLQPGDYRFHVIAANDDGLWNGSGAVVRIALLPHFHQTRFFAFLIAAVLASAIWVVVAFRIRSIQRAVANAAEAERQRLASQRMEALGLMASGIAHDFNNTLMSALPWAELIRRKYPHDVTMRRAAENIMQAVSRARNVTQQLLDFAQPKQPGTDPVDLVELVSQEVSMARSVIPPAIEIETKFDPDGAFTLGDRTQLARVVMNLLLNARDAMSDGGRLSVEVREPTADERQSWLIEPESVLCSISDTGSGIDEETVARMFDPFFTTKELGKGTGLGLAVVDRVVRDHKGSIRIDSVVGRGTTFVILLPRSAEWKRANLPADALAPVIPSPENRPPARVLLIDDEETVAEGIRFFIEEGGMTVVIARTGPDALRRLDEGLRPDLVVLDLGLPGMSGDQVWREIRARLREVPIIISSGYGDRERLDPLLADPRTAYLQKPYEIEALMQCIATLIRD